jgi:hypothetical protein
VVDGKAYQCPNTKSSFNPQRHIHEQIQVAYDPMNPSVSVISKERNYGMGTLIYLGLWFMFVAGITVFKSFEIFMRSTKFLRLVDTTISCSILGVLWSFAIMMEETVLLCAMWLLSGVVSTGIIYEFFRKRKLSKKKKPEPRKKFFMFESFQIFIRSSMFLTLLQGNILFILPILYSIFKGDIILFYAALSIGLVGIGYNYYIVTRKKRQKKKPEPRKKFLR